MIEKMKKLTVLLYHREKEQFLQALRNVGVVHIVEDPAAVSDNLVQALENEQRAQRVLTALRRVKAQPEVSGDLNKTTTAEDLIRSYEEIENRRESLNQMLAALTKQQTVLEPWGDFDPAAVARLKEVDVTIRFFEATAKHYAAMEKLDAPVLLINQVESKYYVVVLERRESIPVDADEVRLPALSLSAVKEKIADSSAQLSVLNESIARLASATASLEAYIAHQKGFRNIEAARLSMGGHAHGSVVSLTGWVPEKCCDEVKRVLEGHAAWYALKDPKATDTVPVLLRQSVFSRLFSPILKVFSLPDYFELDPTPFFAPFFMFFVGMCLGDVGYGAILFIGAIVAYLKVPSKFKGFAALIMVLAVSTMFNGVLLNSFFGSSLLGGPGVAEGSSIFSTGAQFAILGSRETEDGMVFPAMQFSIAVGVVQVLLGMFLCTINRISLGGLTFGLQPIGYIFMVVGGLAWAAPANLFNLGLAGLTIGPFAIGGMLVSIPLVLAKGLFILGVVLHFLFNNPDQKIWLRVLDPTKGILEFYFFASGVIGNMLSYLRLFALGLSSGLLGSAFTQIALMFIMHDGKPDYFSPYVVLTILVLLIGHSLNLALAMIGSFVHPLRLTFVEFYTNLGFRGGGKAYAPLAQPTTGIKLN